MRALHTCSRFKLASFGLVGLLSTAPIVFAETSPLSAISEGFGMEESSNSARERAMGDAGLASINKSGPALNNPSRTAWNEKTSFSATFASDIDYLQDKSTSNRTSSFLLPTIAMNFQTRMPLNIGLFYQQRFHRNFNFTPLESNSAAVLEGINTQGGIYEVGGSLAYAPITSLSLGVGYHYILGRERAISSLTYTKDAGNPELLGAVNLLDTVSTRSNGGYPSASMTFRQKNYSLAISGAMDVTLDQTLTRTLTGIGSNQISHATSDMPWSIMAGGAFKISPNQTIVSDFTWQSWEERSGSLLNPAYKVAAGYEFQGAGGPYEKYYRKVSYRGGAGYERLYLDETDQFYLTTGLGMPLGRRGNVLDAALKYGHRGSVENSLWSEDFIKLSVTLTGVGVWGKPVRKRR